MPYETSYDVGLRPFNPDKERGKWASPMDFFFACFAHCFRIDTIFILPELIFQELGIYGLIPYLMVILICTLPIVFMQSFLGQFSSTGFISVLRVAPLFKGIGYASLAINTLTLSYYSIFAAIPLLYFLHSLRSPLPWGCKNNTQAINISQHCNIKNLVTDDYDVLIEMPSLQFFLNNLNIVFIPHEVTKMTFAYSLLLCTFTIWIIVWLVVKNPTELIGRILRYSTRVMLSGLGICVLRFAFLPGAFTGLMNLVPKTFHIKSIVLVSPLALSGLGPGWGSILTMASFNNFKTNITKYTWILCLGQMGLMLLTFFSWNFILNFLNSSKPDRLVVNPSDIHLAQFISIPAVLSILEMPHLWSLLFFGVLAIGSTNLLIVQLLSVLISLFDEFEQFRMKRKKMLLLTVAKVAFGSIICCSSHGILFFAIIAKYSLLTQMFLNLMLLLVVLWVYGRERFQRDLHFMTGRTYPTWMVHIVRFVAPSFLLFSLLIGLLVDRLQGDYTTKILYIMICVIVLPWFLIPGYCIFKLIQTRGMLRQRFKRCIRPTDWYPIDPVDRQAYEDAFSDSDITHQLRTIEEDA